MQTGFKIYACLVMIEMNRCLNVDDIIMHHLRFVTRLVGNDYNAGFGKVPECRQRKVQGFYMFAGAAHNKNKGVLSNIH